MGDNRLTGIVVMSLSVFYLWLYNTGRAGAIADILRGVPYQPAQTSTANTTSGGGNNDLANLVKTGLDIAKLFA